MKRNSSALPFARHIARRELCRQQGLRESRRREAFGLDRTPVKDTESPFPSPCSRKSLLLILDMRKLSQEPSLQ